MICEKKNFIEIRFKSSVLKRSYFIIPEIHRKKHVRWSANVHSVFLVGGVEDVDVAVVAGRNEVILVEPNANGPSATRTRFQQGTGLWKSGSELGIVEERALGFNVCKIDAKPTRKLRETENNDFKDYFRLVKMSYEKQSKIIDFSLKMETMLKR